MMVVPPKTNIFKSKTSTKKSLPKPSVDKRLVVARVSYPSSSTAEPTFELPRAHKIYSKNYTFPYKLYDLLNNAQVEGYLDIISFSEDGNEFLIHDHARFASEILPQYFGHDKLRSFDRQLSYWGFKRSNRVPNSANGGVAWMHPCMKQGQRALVKSLKRTPDKSRKGPSYSKIFLAAKARRGRSRTTTGQNEQQAAKKIPVVPDGDTKCLAVNSVAVTPSPPSRIYKTLLSHQGEKPILRQYGSPRAVSPFGGTIVRTTHKIPIATTVSRRVSNASADPINPIEEEGYGHDASSFDEDTFDTFVPLPRLESMELGSVELLNHALRQAQANNSSICDFSTEDAFEGNRFHLVDELMEDSDVASLLSLEDVPDDAFIDLDGDGHNGNIPSVNVNDAKSTLAEFECSNDVFTSFLHDHAILPDHNVQEQQKVNCLSVKLDEEAVDVMDALLVEKV
jgi:hypothetical protein